MDVKVESNAIFQDSFCAKGGANRTKNTAQIVQDGPYCTIKALTDSFTTT